MVSDDFEKPRNYKGWIYPVRYLLALRYLKIKQKTLVSFRDNKVFPIPENDFKEKLIGYLLGRSLLGKKKTSFSKNNSTSLASFSFKSMLVYPALLVASLFGLVQLNDWYQTRKIENVLANHLPFYSDLVHQKLMLRDNNRPEIVKKIEAVIDKEKNKILSDLPEKDGIREMMAKQLTQLQDTSINSEKIMLGFKDLNTLFDEKGLSYYLTPKSFSMACSSLINASVEEMMMLQELESLMSDGNPEVCRTTMMTVYKVNKRDALIYAENREETELPLFHVNRIDKVPAVDSALGLTFKDRGIGSIILTDRIENFSQESVLPALTFQGRNYIIPYWMQGYYEIEEAITNGYKKDLEAIYPNRTERNKVKKLVKKIIKNKNRMQNSKMRQTLETTGTNNENNAFANGFDAISVLLGKIGKPEQGSKKKEEFDIKFSIKSTENRELLKKLNDVLLPSIEYHEAYHQINKKEWPAPAWLENTFGDEKMTDSGLDHTMEELGAYLSQLSNTRQGHNIWLSKLLIFSLNPMTKGQAEYYASSIILTTLESLYLGSPIQPNFSADVDKKTKIYNELISLSTSDIRELSKRAFEVLFEREVPVLW